MTTLQKQALTSAVVATVLTGVSYLVGLGLGWITELNWLEVFAVWTSYSCTYLCVVQSRWNYPIGAISTAALAVLFYSQGLYSSAALNAWLAPALLYGWFRWGPDKQTRPVTLATQDSFQWKLAYILVPIGAYLILLQVSTWLGATLPVMDSFILVGSILAQFLLDNKKLENWAIWAVVNVVAIITYSSAGLWLVAFQFVFFLGNTIYGWAKWQQSRREAEAMESIAKLYAKGGMN